MAKDKKNSPYAKEIAILSDKVRKGTVSRTDSYYQMLDSKRNIPEVKAFLETKIDGNLH